MSDTAVVERILETLTTELAAQPETVAVIVHGSYVKGTQHADSDLDVLCLIEADWLSMEIRDIEGIPVELHHTPVERARGELRKYSPTNDNFQLQTLTEGRVLFERGEALSQLRQEAEEMKRKGPKPPNPLEVYIGRAFMRKRLSQLRLEISKTQTDSIDGMVRVMADIHFKRCLGSYCRTHRLWGTKFPDLVAELMESSPELGTQCRKFLDAKTHGELLSSLEQISELTIAPIGWGSPFSKTGRIPLQAWPTASPSKPSRPSASDRQGGSES